MRIITSLIICCLFKLGRIFVNSSIPEELSFLSMQENKFKALVLIQERLLTMLQLLELLRHERNVVFDVLGVLFY